MSIEKSDENDGIGTPETRELVEKIARGNKVTAEEIIDQVSNELSTMTNTQLVDLHHCLQEWGKRAPTLWPHHKDWEKTIKMLSPMSWYIHGLVGTVAGMLIWTTLQVMHEQRAERMQEVVKLVLLEIQKRRMKS